MVSVSLNRLLPFAENADFVAVPSCGAARNRSVMMNDGGVLSSKLGPLNCRF
jgi:hypothetical protein